jgi:repressor LexA
MKRLSTEKVKDGVLRFITDFISTNGYSPTVREICKSMGFKSSATGQKYIDILKSECLLSGSARQWRTTVTKAEQYKPFKGSVKDNGVIIKIQLDKKSIKILHIYCQLNNLSSSEGIRSAVQKLECFMEE